MYVRIDIHFVHALQSTYKYIYSRVSWCVHVGLCQLLVGLRMCGMKGERGWHNYIVDVIVCIVQYNNYYCVHNTVQ